jgi:predicted RNase H-like HicB family nuclease
MAFIIRFIRTKIAYIPDLNGCSAFGATTDEALAYLEEAKAPWVAEAARRER